MTRSMPDLPRPEDPGDLLTVEAPTAADAVARVHEQLGPDARIVHASKVLRGGMWGFFPKEVVQLQAEPGRHVHATDQDPDTAVPWDGGNPDEVVVPKRSAADWPRVEGALEDAPEPGQEAVAPPASSVTSPTPTGPGGVGSLAGVLADLAAAEDHEEAGLGAALRRHLGVSLDEDEPAMARPAGGRSPRPRVLHAGRPDPLPEAASPRGSLPPLADDVAPAGLRAAGAGPVAAAPGRLSGGPVGAAESGPWSARALLHLGLSRGLVDTVLEQRPHDDASWTYALARAVSPLCRPLPAGPSLFIGPRAGTMAGRLSVPVLDEQDIAVGELDRCATSVTDPTQWPTWMLDTPRGARWLHLVVGGRGWRALLDADPLAVSWLGEDNLGQALCTAHELGMVLGWGVHRSRTVITPSPIELSMVVRGLLGGAR